MNDYKFQRLVLLALRMLLQRALGNDMNMALLSWEDQVLSYISEQDKHYNNLVHK